MLWTSGYRRYFSFLSENPLHDEAQDVNTYFPASTEMLVGVLKLFLVLLIWGLECFFCCCCCFIVMQRAFLILPVLLVLLHDENCEASLSVFQPLAESEHKWLFDTLPKNLVSSLSRHSFSNPQQRYRWDRKVLCDIRAYFHNNSILNPLKKSKLRLGTLLSFLWNSCEFCTNGNLNVTTSAAKFQNSFAVHDLSVCPDSGFVGQFEISHNLIFFFYIPSCLPLCLEETWCLLLWSPVGLIIAVDWRT